MYGNTTIPIPGELRSVIGKKIVTSADGVFDYVQNKKQEEINEYLNEIININAIEVDENGNTPVNYKAGDIFFANNMGRFDCRYYYIAFFDGVEGDSVRNALKFNTTPSSIEAIRLSYSIKLQNNEKIDLTITQNLTEEEKQIAKENLGIVENVTFRASEDEIRELWQN